MLHTDMIMQDKVFTPVEFGHKVLLVESYWWRSALRKSSGASAGQLRKSSRSALCNREGNDVSALAGLP